MGLNTSHKLINQASHERTIESGCFLISWSLWACTAKLKTFLFSSINSTRSGRVEWDPGGLLHIKGMYRWRGKRKLGKCLCNDTSTDNKCILQTKEKDAPKSLKITTTYIHLKVHMEQERTGVMVFAFAVHMLINSKLHIWFPEPYQEWLNTTRCGQNPTK